MVKVYVVERLPRPEARRGEVRAWAWVLQVEPLGTIKDPLRHEVRHSPGGFEAGYGGSGPSELARCLLLDHLGRPPHPALYQDFKVEFVMTAPEGGFAVAAPQVTDFVRCWAAQHPGCSLYEDDLEGRAVDQVAGLA